MITIRKSKTNKIIAGVCGGLSDAFGINLNIVRLIFFISIFFGGIGIVVYLLLMFILPEDGFPDSEINEKQFNKKLIRGWENRKIAGVCAGLSKFLNLDIVLIRLIFLFSVFIGGFGVFIYILLWLILPSED
jgi:phage shock protein PspC (stress-responsive transcriptional regulator)